MVAAEVPDRSQPRPAAFRLFVLLSSHFSDSTHGADDELTGGGPGRWWPEPLEDVSPSPLLDRGTRALVLVSRFGDASLTLCRFCVTYHLLLSHTLHRNDARVSRVQLSCRIKIGLDVEA